MNTYSPGARYTSLVLPSAPVMLSCTRFPALSYMATLAPGTGFSLVKSVLVILTGYFASSLVKEVVPDTVPSSFMVNSNEPVFSLYPRGAMVSLKVYLPGVRDMVEIWPLSSVMSLYTMVP